MSTYTLPWITNYIWHLLGTPQQCPSSRWDAEEKWEGQKVFSNPTLDLRAFQLWRGLLIWSLGTGYAEKENELLKHPWSPNKELGETVIFPFNPISCPLHCFNSWCFQIYVGRQTSIFQCCWVNSSSTFHRHSTCPSLIHFSHVECSLPLTSAFAGQYTLAPASQILLRSFFLFPPPMTAWT